MRRVLGVLACGLAILAGGCTIEAGDLEETEERYLERVRSALAPLRAVYSAFEEAYALDNADRFESSLDAIAPQGRIVRVFREVQDIRPPPRFFDDQRRLLETLVAMSPVARSGQELVAQDELVKASTRFAHTSVLFHRMLPRLSSRFCVVVARTAAERQHCDPLGILPGAGYGERLHSALARGSAEFTPRGFLFVSQAFSNTQVAAYLNSIGPSLVEGVSNTAKDVEALVPPDEFAADHRVITSYFDDFLRVSRSIDAAAESNPARLRSLFPESQRIVDRARDRLSEDIRPAVAVWFFPAEDDGND